MAMPESYLSYARWDDKRVIDSLTRLQERKLPVYVVIGSKDNRIDEEWVKELGRHATQLTIIEGANHFFSSIHEFDLSDQLETILTRISAPGDEKISGSLCPFAASKRPICRFYGISFYS